MSKTARLLTSVYDKPCTRTRAEVFDRMVPAQLFFKFKKQIVLKNYNQFHLIFSFTRHRDILHAVTDSVDQLTRDKIRIRRYGR